ncbi:MAG: HlyD family efflux transporter periplasmic adaptor subunit [Gammaproteobacteria bacterium]|jgi:multidrug resistance efflux pump
MASAQRRFLTPVGILALALLVAFGLIKTRSEPEPIEIREKAWLVSAEPVTPKAWAPTLTLYGRVESLWSTELTAAVAAEVLEVPVIEGSAVTRGDLVMRLDERDAALLLLQREAELREAEARIASENTRYQSDLDSLPRQRELLNLARAEVTRLQDLVKRQVGSASDLDRARQSLQTQALALDAREQSIAAHPARLAELEAGRERAVALRDQARLDLERCRVVAPFNGRVARILVSPGRRVRVGDPLLVIYDTDALVVRAQVPNRHLPTVRRAQAAGKALEVRGEIDDVPVTASLLGLAGEVDAATGGVEALFRVTDADTALQQGRFVRLDLHLPPQPGLVAVPHEALYGGELVYLIDADSRMRALTVERVGETRTADGQTWVLIRSAEFAPGQRLVTTQIPNAVEGLLVRLPGGG